MKHLNKTATAETTTGQSAFAAEFKPGPIEVVVRRLGWLADGRSEAIAFAIKAQCNLDQIDAEIQERTAYIIEAKDRGSMAPSASPRIWLDSYIETLREIHALVQSMQQDGKTWHTDQ